MLKDNRALPTILASLLGAGALFAAVTARSEPPDPAAPAEAPSGSGTGSGTASGSGSAAPLPPLHGSDIPAEAGDMPPGAEWKSARKVRLTRDDEVPCEAMVLRDWLRVECSMFGATLFAGDPADVKIIAPRFPLFGKQGDELANRVNLYVHLRRGNAVMFQLHTGGGGGYGGVPLGNAPILAVAWREGQPDPTIVLSKPGE